MQNNRSTGSQRKSGSQSARSSTGRSGTSSASRSNRSSASRSNRNSAGRSGGSSLNIIGEGDSARNRSAGRNVRSSAGVRNINRKKQKRRKRMLRRLRRDVIYITLFLAVFAVTSFILGRIRSSNGEDTVEAQKISNVSLTEDSLFSGTEDLSLNLTDVDLTGITIAVDPGHGGEDPGCMEGSVWECNINLAAAEKVTLFLEKYGATVIMTRTEDGYLSLTERADIANEAEADYFVSLHCNSYDDDSSISGLECYYYPGMTDGEAFAAAITGYMEENTDIYVRKYEDSDLSVLRNTAMTAVLIEMGYMSNPTELKQLTDASYQSELAQAIAEGIVFAISQE